METGNIAVLPPPGMTKTQLGLQELGGVTEQIPWDAAAAEAGLGSRNSSSTSLGREDIPKGNHQDRQSQGPS